MQINNYVASLSDMNQTIDNQAQRTYNAKEVGEIFGYMLQSLGYPFQPTNLNNGIAQAIQQPLATPKRMTMTVKDVAQELNTSTQTVRAMIKRDELPAFKVGKNYAISRTKFERWVMRQGQAQEGEQREAC